MVKSFGTGEATAYEHSICRLSGPPDAIVSDPARRERKWGTLTTPCRILAFQRPVGKAPEARSAARTRRTPSNCFPSVRAFFCTLEELRPKAADARINDAPSSQSSTSRCSSSLVQTRVIDRFIDCLSAASIRPAAILRLISEDLDRASSR